MHPAKRLSAQLPVLLLLMSLPPPQALLAAQSTSATTSKPQQYIFEGRKISTDEYHAIQICNDATNDMNAGNWAVANTKLEEALKLGPNLYQAHSNHAVVLARLGRLQEAKAESEMAAKLGPSQPEPLLAQAAVSQELGQLDSAVFFYDEFLKKFPNHPMAATVRPLLRDLRAEAGKAHSVARTSGSHAAGTADDYFENATYDAITKWDVSRFPLKVFVPTDEQSASVPGYKPEFGQALREGFADWQAKSNGLVRFEMLSSKDGADIDCEWTNDISKVKEPAEGGEARVLFDPVRGIRQVHIVELTKHVDSTIAPTYNLMKDVALHEIGHSLGIIGHSPDPHDVMFCTMPADDEKKDLSERDVHTLAHLYRSDVVVADHDHGPSGGTDKVSLNNDGVHLVQQHQFPAAIQKFEAAMKVDPNYGPVRRNLAGCLNTIAIDAARSGDFNRALANFKRALELENDGQDPQSKEAILRNLANVYRQLGKTADADATLAAAAKLAPGSPANTAQRPK